MVTVAAGEGQDMAADWKGAPATKLEATIAAFKDALPGWWFSLGECQMSAYASCAPTVESEHIALIARDSRFDTGFHADLPQPATMAAALLDVMRQAVLAVQDVEAKLELTP